MGMFFLAEGIGDSVIWMCAHRRNLEYSFRLYLNAGGKRILGKGGAQILSAINRHGSMTMAARELHMSYKFMWDYLTRMRKRLEKPVIVTHRGGTRRTRRKGGGGTTLTPTAKALLKDYEATEKRLHRILSKKKVRIRERLT
jgi:molybdate transport system regulatory protein